MSVVEAAGKLFDFLAARDATFTQHLQPGLSRAEIQALVDPLGIVLPEEALQFYEHYSLPKGYQHIPKYPNGMGQPTFYGLYWMLGLEDAIEQYYFRDYSASYTAEDEFFPGEHHGSGAWFLFLEDDASLYLLDTFHEVNSLCPVISVHREYGPEPEFLSMSAMFETMYDWVNESALAVKEGHVDMNHNTTVGQIAIRHNPEIARWKCMAAGTT